VTLLLLPVTLLLLWVCHPLWQHGSSGGLAIATTAGRGTLLPVTPLLPVMPLLPLLLLLVARVTLLLCDLLPSLQG
jgi:hypothetical protein